MLFRIFRIGLFGFIQLIRTKTYVALLASGFACILLSLVIDVISGGHSGRIFLDIALFGISIISCCLGGIIAIHLIAQDIQTKRIHSLMVRPLFRFEIIFGHFTTVSMIVLCSNLFLGALLAFLLGVMGYDFGVRVIFTALFFSPEAFFVASFAILMGIGSSASVSSVVTLIVFFAGRLSGDLGELIAAGKFGGATQVMKLVYYALPQLHRFNLSKWAHDGGALAWGEVSASLLHGLLFTCGVLCLAAYRFQKKDLY